MLLLGLVLTGAHVEQNPERPLAFVQKFKPHVGVQNAGAEINIKERGKPLFNGDTLQTDDNGFALVQFMDKSLAKVKPNSRLVVRGEVKGKNKTSTRIGLELGEIYLNVTEQGADNFEVATKAAVATVKGTRFGVSSRNYFWVQEGEVEVVVNQTGESLTLTNKTFGRVKEDGSIEKGELSEEEIRKNTREYGEMDEQMKPKIYELQFIDEDGRQKVLKVKVFENNNK